MKIDSVNFFIGYDSKEDIAYRVCKSSLLKRSTINIKVNSLKIEELIAKKFYNRSYRPFGLYGVYLYKIFNSRINVF